jgi:hypothetical protein
MKRIWLVAGGVVLLGIGFAAGFFLPRAFLFNGGFNGGPQQFGGGQPPSGQIGQFGPSTLGQRVSGELTAIDESSLTVDNSGKSTTFVINEMTSFTTQGYGSTIRVGDFVQVVYAEQDGETVALQVETFTQ